MLQEIITVLRERYDVEALLLYGSRADGRCDEQSDYDLFGLLKTGGSSYVEFDCEGYHVSCKMVNRSVVNTACSNDDLHYCINGVAVYDPQGTGALFVEKVNAAFKARQKPLSLETAEAVYANIAQDFEGSFGSTSESWFLRRRFLHQSLDAFFLLNSCNYFGAKKALATLKRDAPCVYEMYGRALAKDASDADVAAWFDVLSYCTVQMDPFDFDFAGNCRGSVAFLDSRREYALKWHRERQVEKVSVKQALEQAVDALKQRYRVEVVGLRNPADVLAGLYPNHTLSLICFAEDFEPRDGYVDATSLYSRRLFPAGYENNIFCGGWHISVTVFAAKAHDRVGFGIKHDPVLSAVALYEKEPGTLTFYQEKLLDNLVFQSRLASVSQTGCRRWLRSDAEGKNRQGDCVLTRYRYAKALMDGFKHAWNSLAVIAVDESSALRILERDNPPAYDLFVGALKPGAGWENFCAWSSFVAQHEIILNVVNQTGLSRGMLDEIVQVLQRDRDVSAIVLYGSRATATHAPTSDYDLFVLCESGGADRVTYTVSGKRVNCKLFNKAVLSTACSHEYFACAYQGIVVYDPSSAGKRFVEKINEAVERRVHPLSLEAKRAVYDWIARFYYKAQGCGASAWLARRLFLAYSLIAIFLLNDILFLGMKKALMALRRDEPQVFALYQRAFGANAQQEQFNDWFEFLSKGSISVVWRASEGFCSKAQSADVQAVLESSVLRDYAREYAGCKEQEALPFEEALKSVVDYLEQRYDTQAIFLCGEDAARGCMDGEGAVEGCSTGERNSIEVFCFADSADAGDPFPEVTGYLVSRLLSIGDKATVHIGGWPVHIRLRSTCCLETNEALTPEFFPIASARLIAARSDVFAAYQKNVQQRMAFLLERAQVGADSSVVPCGAFDVVGAPGDFVDEYCLNRNLSASLFDLLTCRGFDPMDIDCALTCLHESDSEVYEAFCEAIAPQSCIEDVLRWYQVVSDKYGNKE